MLEVVFWLLDYVVLIILLGLVGAMVLLIDCKILVVDWGWFAVAFVSNKKGEE